MEIEEFKNINSDSKKWTHEWTEEELKNGNIMEDKLMDFLKTYSYNDIRQFVEKGYFNNLPAKFRKYDFLLHAFVVFAKKIIAKYGFDNLINTEKVMKRMNELRPDLVPAFLDKKGKIWLKGMILMLKKALTQ